MLPTRFIRRLIWCLAFAPISIATAQIVGTSPFTHTGGGLFINEMSNGVSGATQEYVELVVTGDPSFPTAPVDLSGWILDDNNEDQAGVGTYQGHFTFGSCYTAVPPGSILVLYNAAETNPLLPAPDPTDANGDHVYIIPHNSTCMTACNSNPSTTNSRYCPCASPGAPAGWLAGMANTGDLIQVRDLCGNIVQAISFLLPPSSFSTEVLASPFLYQTGFGSQSGRVIYQHDNVSANWNLLTNYSDAPIAGVETPGAPNTPNNAAMIAAIAAGTFVYGGYVNDCQTNPGLLVVPPDSPDPEPTIQICQGQDLSNFSTLYAPGQDPSLQGYTFGYAYILTTNTSPYNILQFNTTGNFNLAGLSPGSYIIWGFSYFQTENTPNVTSFLTNMPGFATISDLMAYTGCGYASSITFFADNNDTMTLQVVPPPVADAGPDDDVCIGQGTTLTATGGGTYEWSNGPTTATNTVNPSINTTYTVTVSNGVCTDTDAVTITVKSAPTATLNGSASICSGESTGLTVSFTGTAPFTFIYTTNGGSPATVTTSSNPYTLNVSPGANATYTLTSVSDANCSGTVLGSAVVNVYNTMTVTNVLETCGSAGGVANYTVSFQINGGNSNNYTVTGGNGGFLAGNNFTSNPIDNGTGYTFTINDGGACGPISISGNPDCGCVTNVGSIDLNPINNCINEPAVIIHTVPPVLDGNDVLVYILHTSPNIFPPGTILAWSYTPTFSFNPATMTPGVTYYVHAVAGDANAATGVNLSDICASIAGPIAVTWFNPPTASTSGNVFVCLGQSTTFNVNFTGTGPFTFTYTANGAPFSVTTSSNPYQLTVSPVVSTTYQITSVTDAHCSVLTSSVANATVVVGPTASISNTPLTACPGLPTIIPVTFTGNGPFTLTYTANGNPFTITTSSNPYNLSVSPSVTTTYILTSISSGGCPGNVNGSVMVNVSPAPTASLSGGGVVCPGGTSVLNVNFSGTGPFTFTYTANGINPQTITTSNNPYNLSVSPASSTFYQITNVSDANCSNTSNASQTVVVLQAVTATLSGTQSICPSGNATLTVNFTGTGPYTFIYTANGATPVTVNTALNPYNFIVNPTVTTTYALTSVSNGGCAGTFNGSAVVTISNTSTPHLITQTLCFGSSLTVGSTIFSGGNPSGTVILPGAAANGCDSTVIVNLSFYNEAIGQVNATLCQGGSIVVNGNTYNASNTPNLTHIPGGSVMGCDSVIYISLSFYPPAVRNLNQTLCFGQSITIGSTVFNQVNPTGTVVLPGASSHGCDSTVNVSLTFTNAAVNNLVQTLCPSGSVNVNGTVFNQANPTGSVTFTGGSVSGCDSVVNVSLSFYPPAIRNLSQTLCAGQSITVGATVFNQGNPAGSVTLTGGSSSGCDSVVNVSLSFYPPAVRNLSQTLCFGQSIMVGTTVFNQANPSGTVILPGASSHGCDSTVNVNLIFNNATINNLAPTLCPGGSVNINGTVFNQANPTGSITIPGGSTSGCDSVINVSLAFYPIATGTYTDTLCQNENLVIGGNVFDQSNPSGNVLLAGASSHGCDSTVAVNLVFIVCNPGCNTFAGTMPPDTVVVCEGDGILTTANQGNEVLENDDALVYILHEFPGSINPILATSPTGTFDMSALISCHLYYVSAVAGNDLGNGAVDLADPCLSISNAQPVVVVEIGPPIIIDETVVENCPPVVICGTSGTITACTPDLSGINIPPIPICPFDHDTLITPGYDIIDTIGGWSVQGPGVVQSGDTFFVNGDTIVFSNLINPVTDVVAFGGADSVLNYTFVYQWPEYIAVANGALDTIIVPKCLPPIDINIDAFSIVNVTFDIISINVSDGFLSCVVPCNDLSVVVSGGQMPFNLNPGTFITACFGGSFCANVTDALGCSADDCGNVIEDVNVPFVFITGNLEVCPGGLTTLTVQGCPSCSVQWTNGPTTPSITVGAGDYIVFVTDNGNGCTGVAVATVTESGQITSNISEDLCPGETITIHGVVFSETNPSGSISVPGINGACDTLINVNCTIIPPAVHNITQTLCVGQSMVINGAVYDQSNPTGVEFLPGMSYTGCDSTIFVNLSFTAAVVNNLSPTLCPGGSVTVNGTVFNAANPVGSVTVAGGSSGGCDSIVNINLSFYPPAMFNLQQTLCPGQSIMVGNQVFNEANPTGVVLLPNAAVHGCDSTVTVSLMFGASTFGSLLDTICPGESIAIGTEQFDQDHPAGSVIFPGGSAGGCDSILNVSISFYPVIEAGLSGDANICAGDSTPLVVHLTGNIVADIIYSINNQGSTTLSGVSDGDIFMVSPGVSSNYTITGIAIPGYNCTPVITQNATVQVSNLSLAATIQTDFNGYSVSCAGAADGSAWVSANGGITPYNYLWSNGSTLPLANGLSAGTAYVTVSDAGGCQQTDSVTLNEPSQLAIDATAVSPHCYGDLNGSIIVNGSNGSVQVQSYSLDGLLYSAVDSFPFEIPFLGSGLYEISVLDENGCISATQITVPAPLQNTVELGDNIFLILGDSVLLTAQVNFDIDTASWSPMDYLNVHDLLNVVSTPLETVLYTITVTDENGCQATDALTVFVENDQSVFVPNLFSPNGDGINDIVTVFANEAQLKEIHFFSIYDRWGNQVHNANHFRPNDFQFGWDGKFRGEYMNPAVFVWYAEVEFIDGTVKLLKGDLTLLR